MRIAFWSEQKNVGTSFNLAVVASAAVCLHPITAAVVSGGYHDKNLERKFFREKESIFVPEDAVGEYGQEEALAAETQEFFLCSGLDYLLRRERQELTKEVVKSSMRQIVRDRMYYLPASARQGYEWWHVDYQFERMNCIMDAVESCFDIMFIDCGSRRDDYAKKLLKEADICVLNMDQQTEVIGEFYSNPPDVQGEVFFLIGRYFEEALYNRKNLQRIYRIEENRLGAIPYNAYLHAADQMGKIKNGVGGCVGTDGSEKRTQFEKELVRTTNLILRLAGVNI